MITFSDATHRRSNPRAELDENRRVPSESRIAFLCGRAAVSGIALAAGLLWQLMSPIAAQAQTDITSPLTITGATTWSIGGSPYVLHANVTVQSSGSLAVSSGVVVKFDSPARVLTINGGALNVGGTTEHPVIFTSIKDDAADGFDSGGDGATQPAPGDWGSLTFWGGAGGPSSIDHAIVRYGGYGTANPTAGAVLLQSAAAVGISNSRLTNNQRSGVLVSSTTALLTVQHDQFDHNAIGLTVAGAAIAQDSVFDHNSQDGLYLGVSGTPSIQTQLLQNSIFRNGRYGIFNGTATGVTASAAPTGSRNNVFENGTVSPQGIYPVQMQVSVVRSGDGWTNNYWGRWGSGSAVTANACPTAPPGRNTHHLTYGPVQNGSSSSTGEPGPVTATAYSQQTNPPLLCWSDYVNDYPFSTVPFEIGAAVHLTPSEQTLTAGFVRPYLFFDAGEHWTPLNLPQFLAETGYPVPTSYCWDSCDGVGNIVPALTLDNLTNLAQGHPGGSLIVTPHTSVYTDYRTPYACTSPAGMDLWECADSAHSSMYYNLTTAIDEDGYPVARSYWDYWFYYRFNNYTANQLDDHEGDWEGLTVVTTPPNTPDSGEQMRVLYTVWAMHNHRTRITPGGFSPDITGEHVLAYPASGTHATYPDKCTHGALPCKTPDGAPEGDHDGSYPFVLNSDCTAECTVPFPESSPSEFSLPAANETGWNAVNFPWGATGGVFGDAPPTPGAQGRYQTPWIATDGSPVPPPSPALTRSARTSSSPTVLGRGSESDCGTWFGGPVVAAVCDHGLLLRALRAGVFGLRPGTFSLHAKGRRSGSIDGVAQLVGAPLAVGSTVSIRGAFRRPVNLAVRVGLGGGRVATAQFRLVATTRDMKLTILRSVSSRIVLGLGAGQRLAPDRLVLERPDASTR